MKYFTDSVSATLLDILEDLSELESLSGFSLGGGTSLALRFGHRRSFDIDLFSRKPFDSMRIQNELSMRFSDYQLLNRTSGSVSNAIEGVKVDILLHPYPTLDKTDCRISFPFLSIPDIAAMKINAVTNRGSKKDFSDLLLLHEHGTGLQDSLSFFCRKYGEAGRFLAIRSLNWFEDAESEPDPVYLNDWNWETVKTRMVELAGELL